MLITWSRLTTGRLRDPLVGRDLVVGTIAGLVLALLEPLGTLVPPALGYPAPAAVSDVLQSARWAFAASSRPSRTRRSTRC